MRIDGGLKRGGDNEIMQNIGHNEACQNVLRSGLGVSRDLDRRQGMSPGKTAAALRVAIVLRHLEFYYLKHMGTEASH